MAGIKPRRCLDNKNGSPSMFRQLAALQDRKMVGFKRPHDGEGAEVVNGGNSGYGLPELSPHGDNIDSIPATIPTVTAVWSVAYLRRGMMLTSVVRMTAKEAQRLRTAVAHDRRPCTGQPLSPLNFGELQRSQRRS